MNQLVASVATWVSLLISYPVYIQCYSPMYMYIITLYYVALQLSNDCTVYTLRFMIISGGRFNSCSILTWSDTGFQWSPEVGSPSNTYPDRELMLKYASVIHICSESQSHCCKSLLSVANQMNSSVLILQKFALLWYGTITKHGGQVPPQGYVQTILRHTCIVYAEPHSKTFIVYWDMVHAHWISPKTFECWKIW